MTRSITPDMQSAIGANTNYPILLAELDFLSAPARFWNGLGPLSWDGKTWTGAGDLLQIGDIEEASDGTITNFTGVLAGVPSGIVSQIYADEYQGRTARFWLGMLENGSIISEPVLIRQAIMDDVMDTDDGETAVFRMTFTTPTLDQGNNRTALLTHEMQQARFPGDMGLQYATVRDYGVRWGDRTAPSVTMASLIKL